MKYVNSYIEYLKDNPEGYWFKRKWYGWGWTPARWQGWAVTFVYIAVTLALALRVDDLTASRELLWSLYAPFVAFTVIFILIILKKGESPRWQWGRPGARDVKS